MIKVKTNILIVNMDEQTYKLSDFVEEFKKIELKELKTENKVNNGTVQNYGDRFIFFREK